MIIIEMGGKDYNLPEGWNEVNLEMFRKIQRLSSVLNSYKSKTQFALEMTGILMNAPISDLMKLDRESYEVLSDKCAWVQDEIKTNRKVKSFEINGETWMPLDNFNKLSMGDQISIELMISESDEVDILGNILPMMIRRAVKKIRNGEEVLVPGEFDVENYEETKSLLLNNLFITDVLNLQSFFFGGEVASTTIMKATLESRGNKKVVTKK